MRQKYMRQKYMRHMGPHGLHGLGADGPWPMGLKDLGLKDPPMGVYSKARGRWGPMGVYFRAQGRWGPMGSMGLGDPPMGVSSSNIQTSKHFIKSSPDPSKIDAKIVLNGVQKQSRIQKRLRWATSQCWKVFSEDFEMPWVPRWPQIGGQDGA